MEEHPSRAQPRIFPTTHWSAVLAVQDEHPTRAQQALEELCQAYWHPLYSYLRRLGNSPPDCRGFDSGFFQELLKLHSLQRADPTRGRFRAFLLGCLKKFMAREHQRATRQKRGGGQMSLPLDISDAEARYGDLLGAGHEAPDQIYERQWAATLLRTVLDALQAEAVGRGQGELFEQLQQTLIDDGSSVPLASLAARLGLSESAVKMAALRLRERYAVLFREEIARTVDRPEEIEEEIAHLIRVLSRSGG